MEAYSSLGLCVLAIYSIAAHPYFFDVYKGPRTLSRHLVGTPTWRAYPSLTLPSTIIQDLLGREGIFQGTTYGLFS